MAIRMSDVGAKAVTERSAAAIGTLSMSARAFGLLKSGRLPKGDALALAQAAGIMAAKRTSDLLPLCHPLQLDSIDVDIELDLPKKLAKVRCTAAIAAKTGVEMEALTGCMAALLCLYDLIKPVDPALEISGVRLEYKSGGKKGLWMHPKNATPPKATKRKIRSCGSVAVITVSDRAFKGIYKDRSGPILASGLKSMGFNVKKQIICPDEKSAIIANLRRFAPNVDAIILTGGTGLSPRDVTPEAVASIVDRLIPGFGESLRACGAPATSALSRSLAGQLGACVIVSLPGSTGGVRDGLQILTQLLPHAVHIARGGSHA